MSLTGALIARPERDVRELLLLAWGTGIETCDSVTEGWWSVGTWSTEWVTSGLSLEFIWEESKLFSLGTWELLEISRSKFWQ